MSNYKNRGMAHFRFLNISKPEVILPCSSFHLSIYQAKTYLCPVKKHSI